MHRQILEACLPFAILMIVAFGVLGLMIRLSRASWDWRRLKQLHRDQEGGVQSLALVVTLPVFMALICMIIQLSQVLMATMGVHYSAYAGARAAAVWLPTYTFSSYDSLRETPNHVLYDADNPYINNVSAFLHVSQLGQQVSEIPKDPAGAANYFANLRASGVPNEMQIYGILGPTSINYSPKYRKVWTASVLALAPFCPSTIQQDFDEQIPGVVHPSMETINEIVQGYWMNQQPGLNDNVLRQRVGRKLRWAEENTMVFLEWRRAKRATGEQFLVMEGLTYNPADYPPDSNNYVPHEPYEVGWQDPINVHVYHRFGLMPGFGALFQYVERQWSSSRRHNHSTLVDPHVWEEFMTQGAELGTQEQNRAARANPGVFVIHATATMNNDGLLPIYGEAVYEY